MPKRNDRVLLAVFEPGSGGVSGQGSVGEKEHGDGGGVDQVVRKLNSHPGRASGSAGSDRVEVFSDGLVGVSHSEKTERF